MGGERIDLETTEWRQKYFKAKSAYIKLHAVSMCELYYRFVDGATRSSGTKNVNDTVSRTRKALNIVGFRELLLFIHESLLSKWHLNISERRRQFERSVPII